MIDRVVLEFFRCKVYCEWCGRRAGIVRHQPHHIFPRQWRDCNRVDIPENLLALCPWCHDLAHLGRITRRELLEVVAQRMGRTVEEVEGSIREVQRMAG